MGASISSSRFTAAAASKVIERAVEHAHRLVTADPHQRLHGPKMRNANGSNSTCPQCRRSGEPTPAGPPDFDGDGLVGITDFLVLPANWGPCP